MECSECSARVLYACAIWKNEVAGRTVQVFALACEYARAREAKTATKHIAAQASTNEGCEEGYMLFKVMKCKRSGE